MSIHQKGDGVPAREVLVPVCRFQHRLITKEERRGTSKLKRKAMRPIVNHCVLMHNDAECSVTKLSANEANLTAFDSHHVTETCNLKIGNTIFETKKMVVISRIARECKTEEELVEYLLPELIITRLLDCRVHKLLHFMLARPELMQKYNIDFPYEYNETKNLFIYKGEISEELPEGTLELPSATAVLKVSFHIYMVLFI